MNRRTDNKKVDIFKILSLVLLAVILFFTPEFIKRNIRILNIECTPVESDCYNQLYLSNYIGRDYLTVKSELTKNLTNNNLVDFFIVQYNIPSTVKVDVVFKKGSINMLVKSGNYLIIDKNNQVLINNKNDSLPTIINEVREYSINDYLIKDDKFSIELYTKIDTIYKIKEARIYDKYLKLILDTGQVIYFPTEGDVDVLAGSVRLIFSRLNEGVQGIRMEDVREIDLRFKNPILR